MYIKYFECQCDCGDHAIRFVVADDDDIQEIYLEVQLKQSNSFLKRIWLATKYIFGYDSKYGHWDCMEIKEEDIPEMVELLKCGLSKEKREKSDRRKRIRES